MLKKLSSILFEEDEELIEEEEEEEETPEVVKPKPMPAPVEEKKPEPVFVAPVEEKKPEKKPEIILFDDAEEEKEPEPIVIPEPVREEPAKPTMTRIDLTQPIPTVQPKPSLGITVDTEKKPVKPATRPVKQTRPAKPVVKEEREMPVYQFKPVISPIFGVDEKDVNNLKNTTNKINKAKNSKNVGNVSPVLSPIYGIYNDDVNDVEEEEVIATPNIYNKVEVHKPVAPVEDISEFSLDDILKVRDEEFAAEKPVSDVFIPDFPELDFDDADDEPVDLLGDTMSILSSVEQEEDDDDIDQTLLIRQNLFED